MNRVPKIIHSNYKYSYDKLDIEIKRNIKKNLLINSSYDFKYYSDFEPVNIGSNNEITISKLSKKISKILNYTGKIIFNPKFPNGTMRKVLSIKKIKNYGWKPMTSLDQGLEQTIKWFLKNEKKVQYSSNKFR